MNILKIFRATAVFFAVIFLLAAMVINGDNIGDRLAVEGLRSAGQFAEDPVDPWPIQVIYLKGSAVFGVGFFFFQSLIWGIGLSKKRHAQIMIDRVVEIDHPFRPRNVWWGKGT